MANLIPFRALRYTAKAGELSGLVTPQGEPAPETGAPYCAAHLAQGESGLLKNWQQNGVLKRESAPAFYLYEQEFFHLGRTRRVKGVIGLLQIGADAPVALQEDTADDDIAAELRRMQSLPCALSPAAALYREEQPAASVRISMLSRSKPRYLFRQGGATHRLWVVNDTLAIHALRQDFAKIPLLLAGGAARYLAALRWSEQGGPRLIPVFLADAAQDDITLLPFHCVADAGPSGGREALLSACAPFFEVILREHTQDISANLDALYRQGKKAFAAYFGGEGWMLLIWKGDGIQPAAEHSEAFRMLDRSVFSRFVLEPAGIDPDRLRWVPSMEQAMEEVRAQPARCAFFLNPPRLKEVEETAAAGEQLPAPTARFLPQVPNGLVLCEQTNN